MFHCQSSVPVFFFFNDTATTEIYTLSLHDALPISHDNAVARRSERANSLGVLVALHQESARVRSEEHTSELQSQSNLVCRLLLEKNNNTDLATAITEIAGYGTGAIQPAERELSSHP